MDEALSNADITALAEIFAFLAEWAAHDELKEETQDHLQ